MKKFFAGTAATAASLAFAVGALAVGPPYCGTYATPSITAPAAGPGAECQTAIAKNTQKFVKSLIKTRSKCLAAGDYAACPNTKDDAKVQKAGAKAASSIASACAATGGLGSSYGGATGANVGSCTLSQNHGTTEIYIGETHGNGGQANFGQTNASLNTQRNECQASIAKASQKFLPAVLKAVDKCIETKIAGGEIAGIGDACVGSLSPAGYTDLPADTKTAEAIDKAATKMSESIAKTCTGLPADQIGFLFSCPGATSLADLDSCVSCSGYNALFEIVNQQYAETGSIIAAGPGAIQAAVDAGSAGDKFLIPSGNYSEGVFLPAPACAVTLDSCTDDDDCADDLCSPESDNPGEDCNVDGDCPNGTCDPVAGNTCDSDGDNMKFVGCGAATDDRPVIKPPLVLPPTRGFTAAGVDGLEFHGLEVIGWSADGIFVTDAAGVTFRDCLGDGDDLSTLEIDSTSTYAFFPVVSTGVVVEGCEVKNVRDAGIYVGQSDGVVVRHNLVYDNVTGIEIENTLDALVYGNVAHSNSGGLLSFKLPGPPIQTSGGHHFFDNTTFSNNTPNFGDPNSTVGNVPRGTGFMIISEDDSVFENNIVTLNDTYGMLILDQEAVNILTETKTCGELATNAGDDCTVDGDCNGDICVTNYLFDPVSPDQDSENLTFLHNRIPTHTSSSRNGQYPDPGSLFAGNWVFAINTPNNGTCFTPAPVPGNSASVPLNGSFAACP